MVRSEACLNLKMGLGEVTPVERFGYQRLASLLLPSLALFP